MIARSAAKMRAHLDRFSGTLAAGLGKPARRFVAEALYGIAARQSVRLTEIGRALEEPIALAKTETRLSRAAWTMAVVRCACPSIRTSRRGWWWCGAWARRP